MDHRFRRYKVFIDTSRMEDMNDPVRMEDMNDPVLPTRPLGVIGGGIFICACIGAYAVTMILLVAIGVSDKMAQSTGIAICWFIALNRLSQAKTARMPRIILGSIVSGVLYYASLIVAQYFRSSAGK